MNRRRDKPLDARFWEKVTKGGPDDCWLWTGSLHHGHRYGVIKTEMRSEQAHRISWEIHNGAIPEGLFVLHRCDVMRCVNPTHLFLGSHSDNMADRDAKGRVTGAAITRLTSAQVEEIRARAATGITQKVLATRYGVARSHISRIVNGKRRSGAPGVIADSRRHQP